MGPLEAGPAAASERAEPVTDALSQHLQFLAPALDPRVLRRAARELWNSCAGVKLLPRNFRLQCVTMRENSVTHAKSLYYLSEDSVTYALHGAPLPDSTFCTLEASSTCLHQHDY